MTDPAAELRRMLAESERRRRDLEELVERERSERRAAHADADAKATILSVLGRELRAPLNAALAWSRFVRRELLSKDGRDHALGIAERHLDGIGSLVDDLLSISEIGPVRAPRIERVALAQVLAGVARDRLAVTLDTDTDAVLRGDAVRITRLLDRFVASALACAQGDVRIAPTTHADHVRIVAELAPAPTCPRVLVDSWEAATASADSGPASDLGLFVAQKLAEAQGGSLALASTDDGRATLTLTLPIVPRMQPRELVLVEIRAALQVLVLSVELIHTRVRDSADEIPRGWLIERLDNVTASLERVRAAVGMRGDEVSGADAPAPTSAHREAL